VSRTRARPALPVTTALLLSAVAFLSGCSSSADIEADQQSESSNAGATQALSVDTGPEQADRVSTDEDVDAAALVPADVAADGKLTVGVVGAGEPPLAFLADDNSTVVGSEVDIASLVDESLGSSWTCATSPGSSGRCPCRAVTSRRCSATSA
jgi:polar amino acid transport system substrate-binding protein